MKQLLILTFLLILVGCSTSKKVTQSSNHSSDIEQVTIIKETHDTIVKEKEVKVVDEDLLNKVNDLSLQKTQQEQELDSLRALLAMRDKRIQNLVLQVSSGSFSLEPIRVDADYAWAEAGILNNKLYCNLFQKPVIAKQTEKESNTKVIESNDNTDKQEKVVTKSIWAQWPIYAVIFLSLLIVAMILMFLKFVKR